MQTRIAVMSVIVEDPGAVEPLNKLFHEYARYVIGRMGIPYRKRALSLIALAVEAPQDVISTLSGKAGNLPGVSVKTAYSSKVWIQEEGELE